MLEYHVSVTGVVELREIIGTDQIERLQKESHVDALKECFSALMSCEPAKVETQLKSLINRLQHSSMSLCFFNFFI